MRCRVLFAHTTSIVSNIFLSLTRLAHHLHPSPPLYVQTYDFLFLWVPATQQDDNQFIRVLGNADGQRTISVCLR